MKRTFLALAIAALSSTTFAATLATVDGYKIDDSVVNAQVQALSKQYKNFKDTPEVRKQILDQLVNQRALIAASEKSGIQKTDEYKELIKSAEQEITYKLYLNSLVQKAEASISDAEIKTFYNEYAKQPKPEEVKVRHALVKTEDQAKDIIKKIKAKKTTLEKVAKSETLDQGTKDQGGLIDYTPISTFVPEFSKAVESSKKGLIDTPVKTQFGYHVIEVLDKRVAPTPSLEEVKDQIKQVLVEQKVEELAKKAMESIKIDYAK